MKNFLILLITCFLYSCGSYVQPEKQTYTKVAQYEGGNKSDGVVYMSVVFEPSD
jgi:NADH:ubiquinone oxidoreductase subunit 3 (subunit A)